MCGEVDPPEGFYVSPPSYCKPCFRSVMRERYAIARGKRPPKPAAPPKPWMVDAVDPFAASTTSDAYRWNTYQLTVAMFHGMLIAQAGKCLICDEQLRNPCVDHCHTTQRVRGLLCNNCNAGIGYFQENPDNLTGAIAYLATA